MTVRSLAIDPLVRPPDAVIRLPGSKSITNRTLVVSALAQGTSLLANALIADDTEAMIDCLRGLGADIEVDRALSTILVHGTGGRLTARADLWVRQSGTTARFVLPLAAMAPGEITVDGDDQIRSRPQDDLLTALVDLGASVTLAGEPGRLPVTLLDSPLSGDRVTVPGNVSSQFMSGLLLAAPLMERGLTVEFSGAVVSMPYVLMTVDIMRRFGADVGVADNRTFVVHPTGYLAHDLAIEPDASTASYFFAAAAVSQGRVEVSGLGSASVQGDLGFVDVLRQMGAVVTSTATSTEVRGPAKLTGVDVSLTSLSDTAPTLAAIAPFATGPVRVHGIGFVRAKESDRIAAVVTELQRLGIDATDDGDGFSVLPGAPQPATVQTYGDHRIAMAFTVLGLMAPGVRIANPQCVAKTFPEFFDTVDALRAVADAELAVLALDGPAGSGKSTVARLVAERLGLEYLDTGAMYRSVTLAAIEAGIDPGDEVSVADVARQVEIDVGLTAVLIDGTDATDAIRSATVNANVSQVSANPAVRAAMRRQQRAWARRRGGGVLEGRDIGTVVFPAARLKVYITASLEERARRRAGESGVPVEDLMTSLRTRDHLDSNRVDSPLAEAHDAVVLDTTGMSIEDVVDEVVVMFGG
ncbi:MAG: 3-phosphoshikimate 1-carboxyvinyltransferase [Acidimicrobiales bacterium]